MPTTYTNRTAALTVLAHELSLIETVLDDMQKFARTHGLTTINVQLGQLAEKTKRTKKKINRRKEKTNDHRTEG